MSDGFFCDGCDHLYQGDPAATVKTTLVRGDVDLCEKCSREFKERYDA